MSPSESELLGIFCVFIIGFIVRSKCFSPLHGANGRGCLREKQNCTGETTKISQQSSFVGSD